jgi:hypothetical protein
MTLTDSGPSPGGQGKEGRHNHPHRRRSARNLDEWEAKIGRNRPEFADPPHRPIASVGRTPQLKMPSIGFWQIVGNTP